LMILLSYEPSFIILNGPDSFLFNLIHLLAASNIHKEIKKKKKKTKGQVSLRTNALIFASIYH